MKMGRAGRRLGGAARPLGPGRYRLVPRARWLVWPGHRTASETVAPARGARRTDCRTPRCPPACVGGGFAMQMLYRCCAGLDVHKDTVVACVRQIGRASCRERVWASVV